jgi:hypothetical protein
MKILTFTICALGYASAQEIEVPTDLDWTMQNYETLGFTKSDKENAKKSITAIKNLSTSIKATNQASGTANAVISALDGLKQLENVLGIAGTLLSFVDLFLPSEDQLIMDQLNKISGQIESLRQDMSYFFDKVIDGQKQAACFSQLAPYENKIKGAFAALNNMHRNRKAKNAGTYRNIFMDECANAQCADAIRGIVTVISGQGSFLQCDLLQILYVGNAAGSYEQGVRDQVVSKSAYLETLVAMGITAESAYQSMKNKDPNAWKIIQKTYQPGMSSAINHIK